jgi:hypothetical protein
MVLALNWLRLMRAMRAFYTGRFKRVDYFIILGCDE